MIEKLNEVINAVTEFTGLDRIDLAIVLLSIGFMTLALGWIYHCFDSKKDDDSNVFIGVSMGL
jgi:hypothetical protein